METLQLGETGSWKPMAPRSPNLCQPFVSTTLCPHQWTTGPSRAGRMERGSPSLTAMQDAALRQRFAGGSRGVPAWSAQPGWVHAVPLGLGLWFVAMWPFPPGALTPLWGFPLSPCSTQTALAIPWGPGLHPEMLQTLPVTARFTLLCSTAHHPGAPTLCHLPPHLHLTVPSPFLPPGAPGWGHKAGSPGYHLRERRWPPRHAICSATFGDRAGAAVFLGHVSSLPPAAQSRLSVF